MSTNLNEVNQLVLIVVNGRQADALMRRLVEERFYFTQIDSSGQPFLEATVCLLIGFSKPKYEALMAIVREVCRRRDEYVPVQLHPMAGIPPLQMIEAQIGGALIYGVEVETFLQI